MRAKWFAVAAFWFLGCNALVGIEPPIERGSDAQAGSGGTGGTSGDSGLGGSGATGSGGSGGSGATGATGGGGNDGGDQAPCNPTEEPVTEAVFVSPAGLDTNSGQADSPVLTIGKAIQLAKANFATHVYLAEGDYSLAQTLTLGAPESGIVFEGGWTKTGPTWTPACKANRRDYTTISVASAVAVRADALTSASGFRHLKLSTKAKGESAASAPGESMYGVWVSGASSALNLYDVAVVAGDAGDGGAPPAAPAKAGTTTCDGHAGCCTTSAGCGTSGGPTAPATAAKGATAAVSGTFDDAGYVAENGGKGTNGGVGGHGKEGAVGASSGKQCRVGGNCGTCSSGNCQGGSSPTSYYPLVGETGRCGCAGAGGDGGGGGLGGGASVAALVTSGAVVVAEYSLLQAGKGGSGNVGGPGGAGGAGAAGQPGAKLGCTTGCYGGCSNLCYMYEEANGGGAGTPGGGGGQAGDGGGGSGGPSYSWVTVSSTFTDNGANQLAYAAGGDGAEGAVAGAAGEHP